jgi:hypothetical protein
MISASWFGVMEIARGENGQCRWNGATTSRREVQGLYIPRRSGNPRRMGGEKRPPAASLLFLALTDAVPPLYERELIRLPCPAPPRPEDWYLRF